MLPVHTRRSTHTETGQRKLNLSGCPDAGGGRTRTEVSPLPAQYFRPDLWHPGSSHPQEVGTKSQGDSAPTQMEHSHLGSLPRADSMPRELPGGPGSWAPGTNWSCFGQGCGSQPLQVPADSPHGAANAVLFPLHYGDPRPAPAGLTPSLSFTPKRGL